MNNRIVYVDLLRIVATFSVVFLHVAAGNWGNVNLGTFEWNVYNFYDSLVRFGVPIFVMVTGMFLLNPDKKVSFKEIYCKYILRILIALISWSLLYAVYTNIINYDEFNRGIFIKSFLFGHYHLWYLYMLIGLYIITPLLRKIVTDKKAVEYFLILSLIFNFVLPIIIKVFDIADFDIFLKKLDLHFIVGYVGYYIGGYYFGTYDLNKFNKNTIYILGVMSLIFTYIFTNIISLKTGKANSTFYSYFSPNVMIVSLAIFVFFKYEISKIQFKERTNNIVNMLSECSFRIYLVHDFFNIFILNYGINSLNYNPIISVPIIAVTVFMASLITSFIIGRTPLLKRIL